MRSFSLRAILDSFTPKQLLGIYLLFGIFVISTSSLLFSLYKKTLTAIPAYGGNITEGIVGNVRFVNPVLAESQTDRDLTSLVYSGLMRKDKDGNLIPDLASGYEVSEDHLTYTFTLKPDVTFQNGEPVTAEDIVFTVQSIQNPNLKSPYEVEWEGVNTEVLDEQTVRFTLKKEYSNFLEKTTLGILPKDLWKDLNTQTFPLSEYNQKPVGSGPFKVSDLSSTKGIPDTYILSAFRGFALGRPYLDTMTIKLYSKEDDRVKDFESSKLTNVARLGLETTAGLKESDTYTVSQSSLPRVFGLYFNQAKNPNLADINVRRAIESAIDKKMLVTEGLIGFGKVACSPVSDVLLQKDCPEVFSKENSLTLLQKAGYVYNQNVLTKNNIPLSVTITSVGNSSDIVKVTEIIKKNLADVGIQTTIVYKDISEINQDTIKNRDYEILLYGQEVKNGDDLYAFWHSSERVYPGLNLSLYANKKVDDITEEIRKTYTTEERNDLYRQLDTELNKDVPAIFLYTPSLVYVYKNNLHIPSDEKYLDTSKRFKSVHLWYIHQEYVFGFISHIQLLKKIRSVFY